MRQRELGAALVPTVYRGPALALSLRFYYNLMKKRGMGYVC